MRDRARRPRVRRFEAYNSESRTAPRLGSQFLEQYARVNPPPQRWFEEQTQEDSPFTAPVLSEAVLREKIACKYTELGLKWGWRLLYCPLNNLTSNSGILVIGLNPKGREHGRPEVAAPGCAYIDEHWGRPEPGQHPLQRQVQKMFELIARPWGVSDWRELLRNSIAGNLVPFRSPSWTHLASCQHECVSLGEMVWRDIIACARPRLILAITRKVSNALLRAHGFEYRYDHRSTGWGSICWSVAQIAEPAPFKGLIVLPHLSRFSVFGRDALDFEREFVAECRKYRA